jgi:uncharacterized membrane protein HdeD (DUF308 family)
MKNLCRLCAVEIIKGDFYMSNGGSSNFGRERLAAGITERAHKWGWYLALGIFLIFLGASATASSIYTTLFSVVALGGVLVIAGGALIILSFLTGRWGAFLFSLASGIFSLMTGAALGRAPLAGAATVTLAIALFLLISGAFRALASAVMALPNWGWSVVSGILSFILGVILISAWPAISLVFLGYFIGIDLIVHGLSWCTFAITLRSLKMRLAGEKERPAAA